ncbi:MAG: Snf7 family protein [Candidatus Bathyarchaeia archaeon]
MIKGLIRSSPPLREIIVKSIHTLKIQHGRLEQATFRLRERDKILFQTCVNAMKNNNKERAAICANEAAEVRKLINFLNNVELAIERVIIRLETIKELSDIVIDLKPALKILQDVSQQLFKVLPDVSSELSKVNDAIVETLNSTKISSDEALIPVGLQTPNGQAILKEVEKSIEKKLAEQLPEPPATIEAPKTEDVTLKEMVALAANCSQALGQENIEEVGKSSSQTLFSFKKAEIQEISLTVEKPSLEEVLLEYVKKSNGEIDISKCSAELKASYEEIEKALENLGAKGKIKVALKSR